MSSPDTQPRIQSFEQFWPYYLGEHRLPLCRWVHFVGTSGFVAYLASLVAADPARVGGAVAAAVALGAALFGLEARRSAALVLLAMIGLMAAANPAVLLGVVFAYFWAWVGHFLVEHNRPATFTYPLWSLAGDFRMWLDMLRGRRWTNPPSELS